MALTKDECDAIVKALGDYKDETERYLRSYEMKPVPCCAIEAKRRQSENQAKQSLRTRLQNIRSASDKVEEMSLVTQ
jgi:hypothetical protein